MSRRLRALVSTALLWGIEWSIPGAILGLATWGWYAFNAGGTLAQLPMNVTNFAVLLGVTGSICGLGFGLFVTGAEHDRTVAELSILRMALWGALAGTIASLLSLFGLGLVIGGRVSSLAALAVVSGAGALLGTTSAAASLAAAKRGQVGPGETNKALLP